MQKLTGIIIGIALGVTVAACGGSSADSDSNTGTTQTGPTDAEFAALEQEVAELKAALETLGKHVNIVVERDAATAVRQKGITSRAQKLAALTSHTIDCTVAGYEEPHQWYATHRQCKSSEGFLYLLSPEGGPPGSKWTWFETTDCTGTALIGENHFSESALAQGIAFAYTDANGTQVGYVQSDGTNWESRVLGSWWEAGTCTATGSATPSNALPVVTNDPAVTKVENTYPANDLL